MMSTPTPTSRRPRPPSALAKSRLSKGNSSSAGGPSGEKSHTAPAPISGNNAHYQPFGFNQRREASRTTLSRISASPGELGNVSLGLDITPPASGPTMSRSSGSRSSPHLGSFPPAVPAHTHHINEMVEPSPPPPYGQELPNPTPVPKSVTTPPKTNTTGRSGTGRDGREGGLEQEERQRARRAAEAAKAIGLDMDFGASNSGGEDDSELEEDEADLRNRLRSVRRRLRQRDKELLMAAQVADQALRQHEQVLSQLSPTAKAHLPQLLTLLAAAPAGRARSSSRPPSRTGSLLSDKVSPPNSRFHHSTSHSIASISSILSPTFGRHSPNYDSTDSPDRPGNFKVLHGQAGHYRRASRPRAFPTSVPSPNRKYHLLQAEDAEQRILALEAALMEAQAGEENQRKAVARMKKDHDKMQRDLERAEGMLSDSPVVSGLPRDLGARERRDNPVRDSENRWRRSDRPGPLYDARSSYEAEATTSDEAQGSQRGNTSASRFESSHRSHSKDRRRENTQRLRRTAGTIDSLAIPTSRLTAGSSWGSNAILRGESRKARPAVSRSSFLSPTKSSQGPKPALTPQLHVQSPESLISARPRSARDSSSRAPRGPRSPSRSSSRSPQRSPISPVRPSPSPSRSLASIASHFAQSPGFTSISNRMASMRDFVADSLFLAPNSAVKRTLGSELGSEYGDEWERSARRRSLSLSTESPPADPPGRSSSEEPAKYALEGSGEGSSGNEEEEWVDEPTSWSGEDESDHTTVFSSPAPLPPLVSAALSSLALALAPADIWDHPLSSSDHAAQILPRGCLRDRQMDGRAYDLLGQAVKSRRIVWVDSARVRSDQEHVPPTLSFQHSGPRVSRPRRESSPSPRPAQQRERRASRNGHGSRTSDMDMAWDTKMVNGASSWEDEEEWSDTSAVVLPLGQGDQALLVQRRGKAPDVSRMNLGVAQRPRVERAGSSQSSIALAHRRVSNQSYVSVQQGEEMGSQVAERRTQEKEDMLSLALREPKTIPGRLVHDILVWALILLEWIECLAVLGMKVILDLKRGKEGILWRQLKIQSGRRRRYYL